MGRLLDTAWRVPAATLAVAALSACSQSTSEEITAREDFSLTSPTLTEGAALPVQHACARRGGEDISPALRWSGLPDGTDSLALIMDDSTCGEDEDACRHWQIFNLPADIDGVAENQDLAALPGVTYGVNWNDTRGYTGSCPGSAHTYHFSVFALGPSMPDIATGQAHTRSSFFERYEEHVLGVSTITVTFDPDL